MKMLHKLIAFLLFLIVLGQGLMFMSAARSSEKWQAFTDVMGQNRASGLCAGVALICVAMLLALTSFSRKKKCRFLSLDSENGTVSISTDAISEYIAKLAAEFPSVVSMNPVVVPGRKEVDIIVNVEMKAGPQIHEACELLQQRVRESMSNGLGISQVRSVEVSVKEIHSEHIRA
ncbi:MAG: alkaline shock response membrane anchor protein AmaP [Kiritimatiellae bacterium]|nr:alkaline shock response membrane anchor protein AmaP [Kiritimatiellia bacterium]